MSYPLNYPTPQNANVQIFTAQIPAGDNIKNQNWVKPQGASFVWFTLIGGGGGGDGSTSGGGSSAVTNFMCPAFLIPDELSIVVGNGGAPSANGGATGVYYQEKTGTGYLLLQANPGQVGGGGGSASTSNYFTAMGFFQSVAGQAGSGSAQTPSSTTFLSGGGWDGNSVTANYGYKTASAGGNGFFQFQPIIVGCGASAVAGARRDGGIGCGGAGGGSGAGGPGICVIITW